MEGLGPTDGHAADPPAARHSARSRERRASPCRSGLLTPEQADVVTRVAPGPLVITPWRGLVLPGGAAGLSALTASGLVATADSPWASISACVGAPYCGQASGSTRALAVELVQRGDVERRTHVSGCERRCGAPADDHRDVLVAPRTVRSVDRRRPCVISARATDAAVRVRAVAGDHLSAVVRDHPRRGRPRRPARADAYGRRADDPRQRRYQPCRPDRPPRRSWSAPPGTPSTSGAPIFTDAKMIAAGITRRRLPKDNEIRCLLDDPRVPGAGTCLADHSLGRRRVAVGAGSWPERWSRSATPRRRCSTCWS